MRSAASTPSAISTAVAMNVSPKALTEAAASAGRGPSAPPRAASRLVSTVAAMATPKLCATCRVALKTAVARPVRAMLMVAKAAVCSGISMKPKPMPRASIVSRIHHSSVSRSMNTSGSVVRLAMVSPAATSRRGPRIG